MNLRTVLSSTAMLVVLVAALGVVSMSAYTQTLYPPEPPENESQESETPPTGTASLTADEATGAAQLRSSARPPVEPK